MGKISGYALLTTAQINDLLLIDDMSSTPTTKKILVSALAQAGVPFYWGLGLGLQPDGGVTDNGPILNDSLMTFWNGGAGQGGVIVLPQCGFMAGGNTSVTVYSTVVIPPYCGVIGMGKQRSMIRLGPSCNCDLIQWMQYNSTPQATLLGVSASTLQNTYYGAVRGMTLHGSNNYQAPATYCHCITAVTNPLTTAAGSDPDFDPFNLIADVECRYASGDGLYANGRSGLQVSNFLSRYNSGNGASPSFDTLFTGADLGFNGIAGLYQNHGSCDGSGKSYNNGNIPRWVSGTSYTAGNRVMYSGTCYACILAVSGSTVPSSDTSHWTAVSATSPQAWGYDAWFDSNAYECSWNLDSQEPTAGSFYFYQAKGCIVTGVSNRPNWDNPVTGVQLGTNPNDYASVTMDGAVGCTAVLGYNGLNSAVYATRLINSASKCHVLVAGDGSSQAAYSPDSTLTGNYVVVDGTVLSGGATGSGMAKQATTGDTGYTLVNGTGNILTWTAPSDGALHSVSLEVVLVVTSNETGGLIALEFTAPDSTAQTVTLISAGQGTGYLGASDPQWLNLVIPSGGTVTIAQYNALTAGAAKLYANIWGA